MVTVFVLSDPPGRRAVLAALNSVAHVPFVVWVAHWLPLTAVPATLVMVTVPVAKVLVGFVVVALNDAYVPLTPAAIAPTIAMLSRIFFPVLNLGGPSISGRLTVPHAQST